MRLFINIDHVATVRQARRTDEPDPVRAAVLAELAGADGITVHLREDRRVDRVGAPEGRVEALGGDDQGQAPVVGRPAGGAPTRAQHQQREGRAPHQEPSPVPRASR